MGNAEELMGKERSFTQPAALEGIAESGTDEIALRADTLRVAGRIDFSVAAAGKGHLVGEAEVAQREVTGSGLSAVSVKRGKSVAAAGTFEAEGVIHAIVALKGVAAKDFPLVRGRFLLLILGLRKHDAETKK